MRIIAGEHRGRNLLPPKSDSTRPITDRAKQSLFDILAPAIPGAVVRDCFAGTGSMGLECLSRGAAEVVFFEKDRSALERLERNIAALGVRDRSRIVPGDLFRWFSSPPPENTGRADLIFLDPPYRFLRERPDDLRRLVVSMAASHLSPQGVILFRHDAADALDLPALRRTDVRTYGSMTIEFLAPPTTPGDGGISA